MAVLTVSCYYFVLVLLSEHVKRCSASCGQDKKIKSSFNEFGLFVDLKASGEKQK